MVFSAFGKAFSILVKKPVRLWGVSLLGTLLTGLACAFGVLPIIVIPIVLVLNFGLVSLYYKGLHGEEINSDLIFVGFKSFWKTAGGMGWHALWTLIWSPVPVVNIIKQFSYCFVPYILLTRPDVSATEALRLSMAETKGYRWKLFGANVLPVIGVFLASLILFLLGRIPYVGILFMIVLAVFFIAVSLLYPLFIGLVNACMYDSVQEDRRIAASRPKGKTCPGCGATLPFEAKFCANCGFNFAQSQPQYQQPQYQQPQYQQPQYQQPQYQQPQYQQPQYQQPQYQQPQYQQPQYQQPQQFQEHVFQTPPPAYQPQQPQQYPKDESTPDVPSDGFNPPESK